MSRVLIEMADTSAVVGPKYQVWDIPEQSETWPPEDLDPVECSNDLAYLQKKYSVTLCQWVW